jgi:hypothetical protein
MTERLIPLLQIGGTGAVVAIALFIMGKWLLNQITVSLNSYVTAYAQETAKIDARIERLEQLAEEQARLTRTVESIKDEITAQRRSHDNRWEFRKDIYVNLVNSLTNMITGYSFARLAAERKQEISQETRESLKVCFDQLMINSNLAPLAAADTVLPLIRALLAEIVDNPISQTDPHAVEDFNSQIEVLVELRKGLWVEGRKDLWGTPKTEVTPEPTTKG